LNTSFSAWLVGVHFVFVPLSSPLPTECDDPYNPAISMRAKQNPLKNATHNKATASQGATTNQYHQVMVTNAKNPALEKVVLGKFLMRPIDVGTANNDNPTSRQDKAWCDSHILVTDCARRGILSFQTVDKGVPVRRAPQIKVCNTLHQDSTKIQMRMTPIQILNKQLCSGQKKDCTGGGAFIWSEMYSTTRAKAITMVSGSAVKVLGVPQSASCRLHQAASGGVCARRRK
jgi:hypothetical protein